MYVFMYVCMCTVLHHPCVYHASALDIHMYLSYTTVLGEGRRPHLDNLLILLIKASTLTEVSSRAVYPSQKGHQKRQDRVHRDTKDSRVKEKLGNIMISEMTSMKLKS